MNPRLVEETGKLARSWMQHEPDKLRDYLVAGVEDPRLNLQSILSRHFIIRALAGERFDPLMHHEYRFSALMNWLRTAAGTSSAAEDSALLLHALKRGADNVEGIEIPGYVLETFAMLPARIGHVTIPNYVEDSLERIGKKEEGLDLDTFREVWRDVMETLQRPGRPSVIEPACGSANDYRFIREYGIAQFVDYTGFDICLKNVQNARALCPGAIFEEGNVFEIRAGDRSYDICFTHDLFEHLSLEGFEVAIGEVCRVTRLGICAGFFQMNEMPDHVVRQVDDYHWNTLSMEKTRGLFSSHGFECRVLHIGSFLKEGIGCDQTHNLNAYTFFLWRV